MNDFKNSGQNGCETVNRLENSEQQQPMSGNYRHKYSGRADEETNWRNRRPVNNGNKGNGYTRENNWRDRRTINANSDRGCTRGRQTPRWPEFGETTERKVGSVCENNLELHNLMVQMNIKRDLNYADKPPPGNAGRDILLLANYFKLKLDFDDTLIVHHYDVTFEIQEPVNSCDDASGYVTPGSKKRSEKLEKRFSGRIIDKMVAENRGKDQIFNGVTPVYDFEKNLYTKKQLTPSNEIIRMEVKANEYEQKREYVYIVSLQYVAKIEMDPNSHVFSLEAMQFFDIALRYGPSRDRIIIGKEIFCLLPENRVSLTDENKELVIGFYQSVTNSEAGLVLNVDRATSLFHTSGPLCELLPEKRVSSPLSYELQSKMVKETARQRPNELFFQISGFLEKFILKDGNQFMDEFEISLNKNMVKLCARVLPAPKLRFGGNFISEELCEGDWDMLKPEKKQCQYGVVINKWILVDLSVNNNWLPDSFIAEFQKTLLNTAKQMGIVMYPPISGDWSHHNFTNIDNLRESVFEEALKKIPNLQLILFIIPDGSTCYNLLKILADLEFGIVTQCVNKKHFRESGDKMLQTSYISNVLLKINAKMNGLNWLLDENWYTAKKIMFVGVDVIDLSPDSNKGINIVSVVGSYDYSFARYDTVFNVQKELKCQGVDLKSAMQKLLDSYKMHNKSLPESIIVYRDGISESQFNQVMVHEVSKLVESFETLKVKPKVTYLVVQKPHNTRFLTVNRDDATRSLNIPVGTVVDTIVTDASKFDFFICSQRGIMSTSIPSRYWILFDENNFTADQIQEITFTMCFMYPCSARSVSVPMPVELAHLSTERAKNHFDKLFKGTEFDLEDLKDADLDIMNESLKVNEKLSQRLYYL